MIIKNNQYIEKKRELIDIYDRSTKWIVLEYFTIVNKILNHYTGVSDNTITEKKESKFLNNPLSLRQINSSFISDPYKEKSFLEKVSFFLSTTKDTIRKVNINSVIEDFNTYIGNLNKLNELRKQLAYPDDIKESKEDQFDENMLNKFFEKYPEYKQAKDEFDRLQDEKAKKIKQMNDLVFVLNKFRQYILDEYNPIALKLLDLQEENDLNLKQEYMEIVEKLHQTIDNSFQSTSSNIIIKSEKLLKWDELKNTIEILEKDNKALDDEIEKIVGNEFFDIM